MRVLIADDERLLRDCLTLLFNNVDGIEVVGAAGDGEEAVVLALNLSPDVVIMDLEMPRMGGFDALRLSYIAAEHDPEAVLRQLVLLWRVFRGSLGKVEGVHRVRNIPDLAGIDAPCGDRWLEGPGA